ncbi:sulfurtransferase, partial [Salmonella enterica subsp. enterica serovar Agona]|nr:sulfurtransferase [Salmonella enterica subsp. enterica serovar Agona]
YPPCRMALTLIRPTVQADVKRSTDIVFIQLFSTVLQTGIIFS